MELLQSFDWSTILSTLITICYALSHVVQYLPETWTAKIPDSIMTIINYLAAKHGSELAAKTDMSGNPVE